MARWEDEHLTPPEQGCRPFAIGGAHELDPVSQAESPGLLLKRRVLIAVPSEDQVPAEPRAPGQVSECLQENIETLCLTCLPIVRTYGAPRDSGSAWSNSASDTPL